MFVAANRYIVGGLVASSCRTHYKIEVYTCDHDCYLVT